MHNPDHIISEFLDKWRLCVINLTLIFFILELNIQNLQRGGGVMRGPGGVWR